MKRTCCNRYRSSCDATLFNLTSVCMRKYGLSIMSVSVALAGAVGTEILIWTYNGGHIRPIILGLWGFISINLDCSNRLTKLRLIWRNQWHQILPQKIILNQCERSNLWNIISNAYFSWPAVLKQRVVSFLVKVLRGMQERQSDPRLGCTSDDLLRREWQEGQGFN